MIALNKIPFINNRINDKNVIIDNRILYGCYIVRIIKKIKQKY